MLILVCIILEICYGQIILVSCLPNMLNYGSVSNDFAVFMSPRKQVYIRSPAPINQQGFHLSTTNVLGEFNPLVSLVTRHCRFCETFASSLLRDAVNSCRLQFRIGTATSLISHPKYDSEIPKEETLNWFHLYHWH